MWSIIQVKEIPGMIFGDNTLSYNCEIVSGGINRTKVLRLPSWNVTGCGILCRIFLLLDGLDCRSGDGVLVRLFVSLPSPF